MPRKASVTDLPEAPSFSALGGEWVCRISDPLLGSWKPLARPCCIATLLLLQGIDKKCNLSQVPIVFFRKELLFASPASSGQSQWVPPD